MSSNRSPVFFWSVAFAFAGTLSVIAFLFISRNKAKVVTDYSNTSSSDKKEESSEKSLENIEKSTTTRSTIVEEVDEDEDEEEDNEDEDDINAKKAYDQQVSMATKYMAGNKHLKAAEHYSEAIRIISSHESVGSKKDVLVLYNNRSAMLEKAESYAAAMDDIFVVLTIDPLHVKARLRRARILEAQGKLRESVNDYMIALVIEQTRGETSPSASMETAEAMCAAAAKQELPAHVSSFAAASSSRQLPSVGYVRPYFESFPMHFARTQLLAAVTASSISEQYSQALIHLSSNDFVSAFSSLQSISTSSEDGGLLAADVLLMLGTFYHLKYNLPLAKECYDRSIERCRHLEFDEEEGQRVCLMIEMEAKHKLAQLYSEIEDITKMQSQLLLVLVELEHLQKEGVLPHTVALLSAWTLLHKVSFWIASAEKKHGEISPNECLSNAMLDVDSALEHLHSIEEGHSEWGLSKKCLALLMLKWTHVKIQMTAVRNTNMTDEEMGEIESKLVIAREADPDNEQIYVMQAEALNCAARFEEAVGCCESAMLTAQRNKECTDCSPLVIMSSSKIQISMVKMQEAHYAGDREAVLSAQESLKDIEQVFERALSIEPSSVEALFRYAHFKSMLGDFKNAHELASKALALARSKEEMEELKKLTIMSSAQLDAINYIQSSMRF